MIRAGTTATLLTTNESILRKVADLAAEAGTPALVVDVDGWLYAIVPAREGRPEVILRAAVGVGTKGFRAEKARILALSRRDRNDKPLSRSLVYRLASLYPEVAFCDDLDALIEAHDGVLKQWSQVDDGFWLKPVPDSDDGSWGAGWTRLQRAMFASHYMPSATYRFGGGV